MKLQKPLFPTLNTIALATFFLPQGALQCAEHSGLYTGLMLGAGFLSGKRSIKETKSTTNLETYADQEKDSATGMLINGVLGYKDHAGSHLYGGELLIGYSSYKKTLKKTHPSSPDNYASSTLKRPFGCALLGFYGQELGGFSLLGKLGIEFSSFSLELETGDTTTGDKGTAKKSHFSPALLIGLAGEMPLANNVDLVISYDYSMHVFHKDVKAEHTDPMDPDVTIQQTAHAPNMHSFTVGAVWHF